MKILLVYVKEDDKLKKAIKSLQETAPGITIVTRKADPKVTQIAEEVYEEYFNSPEFDEDTIIWHPDMYATPGWLETLKEHYDKFDVIGCKIVYPNGWVNHYGGAIHPDGSGFHPHQGSLDIGLTEPLSTTYVTGPGTVVKKYVWDKLKYYDTQFKYYVDVDFCFRAREEGFTVGVVPAKIIHEEGSDTLKQRPQYKTLELLREGHLRFVQKWLQTLGRYV